MFRWLLFLYFILAAVLVSPLPSRATEPGLDRSVFAGLVDNHRYADRRVRIDRVYSGNPEERETLAIEADDCRGRRVSIEQVEIWNHDWVCAYLRDDSRQQALALVTSAQDRGTMVLVRPGLREEVRPHQVDQWLAEFRFEMKNPPHELTAVAQALTHDTLRDHSVPWGVRITAGKILGLDRWAQTAPETPGRSLPRYGHSLVSSAMYRLFAPHAFDTERQMMAAFAGHDGAFDLMFRFDDGERAVALHREQFNAGAMAETRIAFSRGSDNFSIWQRDGESPQFLASRDYQHQQVDAAAIDRMLVEFMPRVHFRRNTRKVLKTLAGGVIDLHAGFRDEHGSLDETVRLHLPRTTSTLCRGLLGETPFQRPGIWRRAKARWKRCRQSGR